MRALLAVLATLGLLRGDDAGVCLESRECIDKVRRLAANPRRFWFGEQWKDLCSGRHRHPVDCFNPHPLQQYHSLGSRLFRASTYQAGFLHNLRIFPRVTFRVRPGSYRACDHDFDMDVKGLAVIEADPEMAPVEPFLTRFLPDVRWPSMHTSNASYIVLFTDVGFGTLNYLAQGFPQNTKVLRQYSPSENFRKSANPVAVLIFEERSSGNPAAVEGLSTPSHSELFDLPKFMLNNGLESALIGMNVVLVSTDAYSIEKQRVRAIIDNCHSLIETKLRRDTRWDFLATFPLSELNAWLSVDYRHHRISSLVCCEHVELREATIPLDPLGDGTLPSVAVMNRPRVSSIKIPQNNANYQRSTRDFVGVVLFDELYTLVLFDPARWFLYWMVIDIPSPSLAAGNFADADTVAPYVPPIPAMPRECSTYVFMLFAQPRVSGTSPLSVFYGEDNILRTPRCALNCSSRSLFDVEQFKAYHQLRLSAINWMTVCFDVHELGRQVAALRESASRNASFGQPSSDHARQHAPSNDHKRSSMEAVRRRLSSAEGDLCSAFGFSAEASCVTSVAHRATLSLAVLICILLLPR